MSSSKRPSFFKTPEYPDSSWFTNTGSKGTGRDKFTGSRDDLLFVYGNLKDTERKNDEELYQVWETWTRDEKRPLRPSWHDNIELLPTTFDGFKEKYPNYKYTIGLIGRSMRSRSRSRSRRLDGGGSRRSLQKSRFLKRKSRKYKSIKKSKKRSFRNRGRH